MSTAELQYIKSKQREFEQLFGKKLEVNFPKMQGCYSVVDRSVPEEVMMESLQTHIETFGTSLENVQKLRMSRQFGLKERRVLLAFTRDILKNNWSFGMAARLVNKHRTTFYHYQKLI